MSVGMAGDEITQLRKVQSNIQDTLLYVHSQSMRSNLVFTNIKESINERHEDCEVNGCIELVFLVVLPALDRQH